jgi:uncharacterized membrane protein
MRSIPPLALSAAALVALAGAFGAGAFELGLWSRGFPGSGLPLIASVCLLPLAAVLLWQSRREKADPLRATPLFGLALLAAYAAALPYGGFAVSTAVLLFCWVRLMHGRSVRDSALVALVVTACAVALFSALLDAPIKVWPHD